MQGFLPKAGAGCGFWRLRRNREQPSANPRDCPLSDDLMHATTHCLRELVARCNRIATRSVAWTRSGAQSAIRRPLVAILKALAAAEPARRLASKGRSGARSRIGNQPTVCSGPRSRPLLGPKCSFVGGAISATCALADPNPAQRCNSPFIPPVTCVNSPLTKSAWV